MLELGHHLNQAATMAAGGPAAFAFLIPPLPNQGDRLVKQHKTDVDRDQPVTTLAVPETAPAPGQRHSDRTGFGFRVSGKKNHAARIFLSRSFFLC